MPEYVVQATNLPADAMVRAYLETAEWCGINDEPTLCDACEGPGSGLSVADTAPCPDCDGTGKGVSDLEAMEGSVVSWSPESVARAEADCADFLCQCDESELDIGASDVSEFERAGHDLWLTRNRHGAGFWDGDWDDRGDELTSIAHSFGECSVYFDRATSTLHLEG